MSEMIERVARAVKAVEVPRKVDGVMLPEDRERLAVAIARAAIEAMREPTHEMWLAGVRVNNTVPGAYDFKEASIYTGMIDAALKES